MRPGRLLIGTIVALVVPGVCLSCPVCFGGASERVLETYHLTAAAMTLLPLLILGVFALWLHRRFRAAASREGHSSQA
jgi:hypothetical protein